MVLCAVGVDVPKPRRRFSLLPPHDVDKLRSYRRWYEPYAAAGAALFVSLYDRSNLCSPVMEALAAGKCIVTLNVGATGDVIRNGKNGVLLQEKGPATSFRCHLPVNSGSRSPAAP